MTVIENLKPQLVWKHFDEIRKIPHCSKHEEKICEYVLNFGKRQGLAVKTDKLGNIVLSKPASPGMEKKPVVVLQGHMDMVCEKNSDVTHDFSKDPIKLKIKDDVLTADGTTLGADNGIGLAISLAILEDKSLQLGPLEALFTVDEETGLTGAFAMANDMLQGRIMLNLDSEDFGVVTVGCAGGGDSKLELPIKKLSADKSLTAVEVKVAGLRGGHSGVDIHEQRGNAVKLLARLLWKTVKKHGVIVADIKGGDKHNAIPREATALVLVKDQKSFSQDIKKEREAILEEIKPIDPKFSVSINAANTPDKQLDASSTNVVINLLHGLPHGVHLKNYDIPDLVETSTNLAKVEVQNSTVFIHLSSRSSIKSALQDMRDRIHAQAILANAKVSEEQPYPGWKPNLKSNILNLSKKVFKDMYGETPKVEAIHAGLECGIIGEKFPGMDMISIGPTIKYPHSPEEQVLISTVEKFYNYVIKILENV